VADKAKYNGTPKYESLKELRMGCNMACRHACPQNAITFVPLFGQKKHRLNPAGIEIDNALCTQCGACIKACPNNNISQHNIKVRQKIFEPAHTR
jgi:ferredoxin